MLRVCLEIFFARIFDVSLGTIRSYYSIKGKTIISSTIAFFEVFVWFWVARQALNTNINSIFIPISYSLGYATGTLIGTFVTNHFVDGIICVQVITDNNNQELIDSIRQKGFKLSIVQLKKGFNLQKKDMYFIKLNKKQLKELLLIINSYDSDAFVIFSETSSTND